MQSCLSTVKMSTGESSTVRDRPYLCLGESWRRAWRCLCALGHIWLFRWLPHLHPPRALATQKSPLAGFQAPEPAHNIAGTEMRRKRRQINMRNNLHSCGRMVSLLYFINKERGIKENYTYYLEGHYNISKSRIYCHIHKNTNLKT